jgi:hypothetical protein
MMMKANSDLNSFDGPEGLGTEAASVPRVVAPVTSELRREATV